MVSMLTAAIAPRRVELAFAAAARIKFDSMLGQPLDQASWLQALEEIEKAVQEAQGGEWVLRNGSKGPPVGGCLVGFLFWPCPLFTLREGDEVICSLKWGTLPTASADVRDLVT